MKEVDNYRIGDEQVGIASFKKSIPSETKNE